MSENAVEPDNELVLIDDDAMAHVIFKALMKLLRPEIPVRSFLTPTEAISKIANNSFNARAIVLDINMPKMNGWEFLAELDKMKIAIPVFMLSSSDDMRDKIRVKEFSNVKAYFVKPLTHEQLKTVLANY